MTTELHQRAVLPLTTEDPYTPPEVDVSHNRLSPSKPLIIVLFTVFLDGLSFGVVMPSIFSYVQSLGGTEIQFGTIVAGFSLGTFLGSPILGMWYNRRSLRESLSGSLLICVFCCLLYAIAGNLFHLFLSRFILGIGSGSIAIIRAYLSEVTSQSQRTSVNTWVNALQILGIVVGPSCGIIFSRMKFTLFGAVKFTELSSPGYFCAILFLLAFYLVRKSFSNTKTVHDIKPTPLSGFRGKSSPRFSRVIIVCLFLNYVLSTINALVQSVATPFVTRSYNWGVYENGLMYAAAAVICILGYILLQFLTTMFRQMKPTKQMLLGAEDLVPLRPSAISFSPPRSLRDMDRVNDVPIRPNSMSSSRAIRVQKQLEERAHFYDSLVMLVGLVVVFLGLLVFFIVSLKSVNGVKSDWVPKSVFYLTLGIVSLVYPGTQTLLISLYSLILPSAKQGTAMGLLMAVQSLALLITPLWSSILLQKYGAGVVFLVEALHFLVAIVLALVYFNRLRPASNREIDFS
ncbi:hypothetical protein RCL1_002986 [Eukaryota sp. TZLM3-RCL]